MSVHHKNYVGGDFGIGKKRLSYNSPEVTGIARPILKYNYHVHSNNVILHGNEDVVHFHTKHIP